MLAFFPDAPQKGSRFKVGVRGPGRDQKSLRLCPQAFASVRGVSGMLGSRKSSRNAELSSLFGPHVSKVSAVTGIVGSWSRNEGLSSLLHLHRVFASEKCVNGHRDRRGPGRQTQKCSHFWIWSQNTGERREERKDERRQRRERRGKRKEERRERRGERREEKGEEREERKREERRGDTRERERERTEKTGERRARREERRERREERNERIEERGEERGEEIGEERGEEKREER